MQWLRIEVIISAIISALLWGLSVASRHGDEMAGTGVLEAVRRRYSHYEIKSRCSKIRALIDDGHLE
jgi:hypothetical protein